MPLFELQGSPGHRELIIVQPPLDVEVRFDEVLITLALGALDRLVPDPQPGTDRFNVIGGGGAAAVRHQRLRGPIPETGGIEPHQGDPGGFGRGDGPGEDGA